MTKTPKNGSSSSTPTPGGGPASVGGAPPSVGSTKSEPDNPENAMNNSNTGSLDNRSGTPASLPASDLTPKDPQAAPGSLENNPELNGSELCDNSANADGSGLGPESGNGNSINSVANENTDNDLSGAATNNTTAENSVKDEIKSENPDPGASGSQPPVDLPADAADLFNDFDTKDGVKDETGDNSDNLAALTDFKEEDLKPFDDACNDFTNGEIFYSSNKVVSRMEM